MLTVEFVSEIGDIEERYPGVEGDIASALASWSGHTIRPVRGGPGNFYLDFEVIEVIDAYNESRTPEIDSFLEEQCVDDLYDLLIGPNKVEAAELYDIPVDLIDAVYISN